MNHSSTQVTDSSQNLREPLPDTVINWSYLHEICGHDRELEIEFLQTLFESLPPDLEKLRTALSDNNRHNIGRAAHLIKGASGAVGAYQLESLAAQIEMTAETEGIESLNSLFLELLNEFAPIQQLFEKHPS